MRDRNNILTSRYYFGKSKITVPVGELPPEEIMQSFIETPGKLFLLYGNAPIFKLSLRIAGFAITKGNSIAVVDGCNQFDVHTFSRFASRLRTKPEYFLQRIFISRGFTCYQIEQTITFKLPRFLEKTHLKSALILGLLDTFYDEQVPIQEAKRILERIIFSLNELKSKGTSFLITCPERNVVPQERNKLFINLKSSMDRVYKLSSNEEGRLKFSVERYKPMGTTLSLHHR